MKRIISLLVTICMLISSVAAFEITAIAAEDTTMSDIMAALGNYQVGDKLQLSGDDYIGIPVELTTFYSGDNVIAGTNGTPIILYVVNTNTERIGTESDVSIIQSMLDRGYVVSVLDYLNNSLAVSPDLEWSVHKIMAKLANGKYYTADVFPASGAYYYETFIVPEGYNVSLNHVYWEFDKHGADGALEKIVEIWNNDFRAVKGSTVIKWVDENGNRKKTQNGFDGTEPAWLNQYGSADANGEYIKVKHTLAEKITDCAKPDGSMIDLNLYMHFIYPTNPVNKVPVMTLASSAEHLAWGAVKEARPQLAGFTFNGYAGAMYDYAYTPMARIDHYNYFDGGTNGAVSGDHMIYSMMQYDTATSNTAAMRLIRYLAASDSKFKFDSEKVGVFGNSKGGCMTFLGEEHPEKLTSDRYIVGHHGESRYDNGKTADEGSIDGGEPQPWLEYNGVSLDSGADFVYASCGDNGYHITENHAPTYVANNVPEEGSFVNANPIVNACRIYDIPSLYVENNQGHTFASGQDLRYNFDTYEALFDFAGYYLKDDAVSIVYTNPSSGKSGIEGVSPVTIKFTGPVDETEISKITVKNSDGDAIDVIWESIYGNTEWSFVPSTPYGANAKYTVTIPASLKGDNGKEMGADYIFSYTSAHEASAENTFVEKDGEAFVAFDGSSINNSADSYVLRFYVANDAANIADIYALSGVDSSDPTSFDSESLITSINLRGSGYYEYDVTDYISNLSDVSSIGFKIKQQKTAGVTNVYTMDANLSGFEIGSGVAQHAYTAAPDGTQALKIWDFPANENYYNDEFYDGGVTAFTNSSLIAPVSAADYGRRYHISIDVYDTMERRMQMQLNTNMRYYGNRVQDMHRNICNDFTAKDAWKTFEFDYDVYDSIYGANNFTKTLTLSIKTRGSIDVPAYFKNLKVTETVTDVEVTDITLSALSSDTYEDKEAESDHPFALYNDGVKKAEYDSWSAALDAYENGYVLKLQSNYSYTDADAWYGLGNIENLDIDLNGYKLYVDSASKSLLIGNASLNSSGIMLAQTNVNVINGCIYLEDTSLISYENSSEDGKAFDFKFDGVTFRLSGDAKLTSLVSATSTPNDISLETDISFNNCVFDLNENNLTSSSMVMFPAGTGNLSVNYTVSGGQIILEDYKKISILNAFQNLVFAENSDGAYTSLVMPGGVTPMDGIFRMTNGAGSFEESSVTDDKKVYNLVAKANSTTYGILPELYSSADEYPFVIFDAKGNFYGAHSVWGNSNSGAMTTLMGAGSGSVVLLRKDYTLTSSDIYPNLAFNSGWRTLDLGGHTLTNTRDRVIFEACVKRSYMCYMNVINGTIVTGNAPVVSYSHYSNPNYNESSLGGFDFRFKDINFKLCANSKATSFIASYATSGKVKGYTSLTDCTIDMMTNSPANPIVLFNVGDTSGTVPSAMTIRGGQLKVASFDNITLSSVNGEANSLNLKQDKNGNYMTLLMPNGASVTEEKLPVKNGAGLYVQSEVGSDNTLYVLDVVEVTKYGIIPSAYSSTEDYPFVIFASDGTFHSGSDKLGDNSNGALAEMKKAGDGAVMLLRRNYQMTSEDSNSEFGLGINSFTVDLGGNTITGSANASIFNATLSDTAKTECIITNGSFVLAGSKPVIDFVGGEAVKAFDIDFDGVTFGITSTFTSENLISAYNTDYAQVNMTLTDCTFDMQTAIPSKAVSLISAGYKDGSTSAAIRVIGGELKASSFDNITISSVNNSKSSITFEKNADGLYTILNMPNGSSVPTEKVTSDKGEASYIEVQVGSETTLYVLGIDEVTEYGTIPAKYTYATAYPFVAFKADGTFISAYSYWGSNTGGGALGALYGQNNAVVLLRADYKMNNTIGQNCYVNLGHHNVTSTVDLGGHTFDSSGATVEQCIMFNYGAKSTAGTFGMNVKNGTIIVGKNPVANFYHIGSEQNDVVNYSFNDITFELASNINSGSALFTYGSVADGASIDVTLNLTDCIYDFTNNPDGNAITAFLAGDEAGKIPTKINIYGGEVKANSLDDITLIDAKNAASYVGINDNTDGEQLYITMPNDATAPSEAITIGTTTYYFVATEKGDTHSKYTLEPVEITEYGEIPGAYADKSTYPFVIFNADGSFKGGYQYWASHSNQAKSALPSCPDGGTILLRTDFTKTWQDSYRNYANLGWDVKNITLDLGGFTFESAVQGTWMFNYGARNGDQSFGATVKNGTIIYGRKGVICFGDKYNGTDNVDFVFDNVKFQYTNKELGPSPVHKIVNYNTYTASESQSINASITYDNCTFDLASAPLAANVALFEAGESGDVVKMDINVNGGNIIASSNITNTWTLVNGASSSITFGTDDNGKLTTLTVPNGTTVPEADVVSGSSLLNWSQSSVGDTNTVYTLSEASVTPTVELTDSKVIVKNVSEEVSLIVASYAGDKLVDVKWVTVSEDTEKTLSELGLNTSGADLTKAFVWAKNGVRPICASAQN